MADSTVKFINTTSTKLNLLSIVDGQIIALSDKSGMYYDSGTTRYNITPVTLSDLYATSEGTAESRVGASSYALASAYNALNNKIAQKVTIYSQSVSITATTTASLGRPVSRYILLNQTVPLWALVTLQWNHNKDWVTWNFVSLSTTTGDTNSRDAIWVNCTNDYSTDLDGTLYIIIYVFN